MISQDLPKRTMQHNEKQTSIFVRQKLLVSSASEKSIARIVSTIQYVIADPDDDITRLDSLQKFWIRDISHDSLE
jgi:hypothetical protein